jgi:hypothetical protein
VLSIFIARGDKCLAEKGKRSFLYLVVFQLYLVITYSLDGDDAQDRVCLAKATAASAPPTARIVKYLPMNLILLVID